ncbi:hypothetical protein ACFWZ2_42240 [Streptomyces sp. NPDC059002]|uniref:hypothetical protein n=1 Tax=Streptomyces sp. NPDC059002 TaxID=3346690 RepID=UPI003694665B
MMTISRALSRSTVAAACGTLLLVATGCGSSPEEHEKPEPGAARAVAGKQLPDAKMRSTWPKAGVARGLAKGMQLPLEPYMLGYPDETDIENAKDRVKADCMKRHGFTFTPSPSGLYPPPSYNDVNMERRYGITDPEDARTIGYGIPGDQGEPPVDEAEEDSRSAEWDQTFNDVCIPEANQKVGILHETDLAAELGDESYEATRQDPNVVKVIKAWALCMKNQGHTVTEPGEANAEFAPTGRTAKAAPAEVETAVADVDCKKQSGLVSTWYTAEVAYQKTQIEENKPALEAEQAKNQKMAKAAADILSHS